MPSNAGALRLRGGGRPAMFGNTMSSRIFRSPGRRRRTAGAALFVLAAAALAFPFYYWGEALAWFGLTNQAVPSDWFGFIASFPVWMRRGLSLPTTVAACCAVAALLGEAARRRLAGPPATMAAIVFVVAVLVGSLTLFTGGTLLAR